MGKWGLFIFFFMAIGAATHPGLARADRVIVIRSQQEASQWQDVKTTYFTKRNFVLAKVRGGQKVQQDLLYDHAKKKLYLIDLNLKTITEVSLAALKRSQRKVSALQSYAKEKLGSLPPEFQKKAREALAGLDRMKANPTKYRLVRQGVPLGQWLCNEYIGTSKGQFALTLRNCAVDWAQTGVTPSQLSPLMSMYQFLSASAGAMGNIRLPPLDWRNNGFPGFPVQTISKVNGKQDYRVFIESIKVENHPRAIFRLPAGFKLQKFPF